MTFYPRGILAFVVFAAILALAVYARRTGVISPAVAIAAAIAALAIEVLVIVGPAVVRSREH
jgi:hypothetical protein